MYLECKQSVYSKWVFICYTVFGSKFVLHGCSFNGYSIVKSQYKWKFTSACIYTSTATLYNTDQSSFSSNPILILVLFTNKIRRSRIVHGVL